MAPPSSLSRAPRTRVSAQVLAIVMSLMVVLLGILAYERLTGAGVPEPPRW